MRRLALTMSCAAGVLLLAGCSHARSSDVEQVAGITGGTAVVDPRWKAVIEDWESDGRLDHAWSCPALRSAVAHLPADAPEIGWRIRVAARRSC